MSNGSSIIWDYIARSSYPTRKPGRGTLLLICTSENTQLSESCAKIHWEVFLKIRTQLWCAGDRHLPRLPTRYSEPVNKPSILPNYPYSPSLRSGLETLCIPWIASLLELLGGTELAKLKQENTQLCVFMKGGKQREGRSRMKKLQIMLLPYCGPFSKLLICCWSSLLKSQHGLLAGRDAFLCTHTPQCLYIITLSSHASFQHLCHY